jgi:hypothetical protein
MTARQQRNMARGQHSNTAIRRHSSRAAQQQQQQHSNTATQQHSNRNRSKAAQQQQHSNSNKHSNTAIATATQQQQQQHSNTAIQQHSNSNSNTATAKWWTSLTERTADSLAPSLARPRAVSCQVFLRHKSTCVPARPLTLSVIHQIWLAPITLRLTLCSAIQGLCHSHRERLQHQEKKRRQHYVTP